ncbi:hypothetical protein CRG98_021167 [Punica granatum]|uniref:Uncharacterized protein n=1 Tax=Punica granatum TaxID=22663 RepID=A0A2I0JQ30_PUNGR|nr:hypothetical protein CRG98_021167 [Punica granatum]
MRAPTRRNSGAHRVEQPIELLGHHRNSGCGLSLGPAYALLDRAAWECPPSRGCVTNTREKESPLIILRPEGRGSISYPGYGPECGLSTGPALRAFGSRGLGASTSPRMRDGHA